MRQTQVNVAAGVEWGGASLHNDHFMSPDAGKLGAETELLAQGLDHLMQGLDHLYQEVRRS